MEATGCVQDCASCYSLTREEASNILKIYVTNVSQTSLERKPRPRVGGCCTNI